MIGIADLIRECKNNAFEANRRLNEYTDAIHKDSTEGIGDNTGGLDEIGQIVSDLATSMDDLGNVVTALEDRVTALEGEKA